MALQLIRKGKHSTEIQNNDPTESLRIALGKFQDALTTEQQQQFKDSTSRPDAADVLVFAARLDAENNSRTRRSVAPRLCTFLNAIQQFAGAVDTFVSSKPEIAALVWGGVKTAITVASNVFSYFDKVTDMIMGIGVDCPTFQEFGHLYPGCVGLQKSLCGYYAVIVELCIKVVQVSGRSFGVQAISSLWNSFESEFKPLIDSLKSARRQVKLQTEVALAHVAQETQRLLDNESQENASFRPSALSFLRKSEKLQGEARQWQINQARREIASLKTKVRHNLSSIDHMSPWKRCLKQKVDLTAEWLVEEPVFLEWKNSPNTALFWCSGTMGTGKTVLMSNVVSYLHCSRKDNEIISHFFCSSENESSLAARSIIGSITRQLLDIVIERSEHEDLLLMQDDTQDLDTGEALEFLLSKLPINKTYFVVLDGLDECEPTQIRLFARSLSSLCQQIRNIKVICAGRPDLEEDLFRWAKPDFRLGMNKKKLDMDIDRYITASLDDCLEQELLTLRDRSIINLIVNTLRDGSEGMFLWAKLCISDLCEQNCDEDILDTLEHLPRGLTNLLDSKLGRVQKGKDGTQAIKLLQYCGVLKRPLALEEYRELLAISIDDKFLDTRKIPNSMNRIIRGCYGLTFIDDEEKTVHFIHQGVKIHLFDTGGQGVPKFDHRDVDEQMGLVCMTYLNFSNFSTQLMRADKGEKAVLEPLEVASASISNHDPRASKFVQSWLPKKERFLGMKFREFERTALEIGGSHSRFANTGDQIRGFPFLSYAETHWCLHLKELKAEREGNSWSLFCKCIEDKTLPLSRPWESSIQNGSLPFESANKPELQYYMMHSHASFVQSLSTSLLRDFNEIAWTFRQKHYALFLYFLRQRQASATSTSSVPPTTHHPELLLPTFTDGSTHRWVGMFIDVPAFEYLWWQALYSIVEDSGISKERRFNLSLVMLWKFESSDASGARLALCIALRRTVLANALDQLELMLAIDKAFHPKSPTFNEIIKPDQVKWFTGNIELWTDHVLLVALDVAGHETIKALLNAGVNANARGKHAESALLKAVKNQQGQVVKDLVVAGAKFDRCDLDSGTLIYAASLILAETPEMEKVLLSAGADFNAPTKSGITPLQMAVMKKGIPTEQNSMSAIKVLLAVGADVNAQDRHGQTALHKAALGGEIETIHILVAAGGEINAVDHSKSTALHRAALYYERTDAVKALVELGADVNLKDESNQTALHMAVIQRREAMVKYLVGAGADINSRAEFDQTPLHLAAIQGDRELLRVLVALGANVNLVDRFSRTALHIAVIQRDQEILESLTSSGANINLRAESGQTPLHLAVIQGDREILKVLIALGADVNLKDSSNQTALHMAVIHREDEMIKSLITAGADVNARAEYGQPASHLAAIQGEREISEALVAVGADFNQRDELNQTALDLYDGSYLRSRDHPHPGTESIHPKGLQRRNAQKK